MDLKKSIRIQGDQVKSLYRLFEGSVYDYDGTYTLVKKVLKIIGVPMNLKDSRFTHFCWNAYFWFSYINIVVSFVLESASVLETSASGTFLDVFTMMPCVGFLIVALTKTYKIKIHRATFKNLVYELRDMWPNGHIPEEEHQVVNQALRRLKFLVRAYFSCNMILGTIFVIPALYAYIKRLLGYDVALIMPFSYWLPFDPLSDIRYPFVMIVISYHCFQSAFFMVAGDLLLIIFLSHVTTQFSLLAIRINKLFYVPIDEQLIGEYPLGEVSMKIQLHQDKENDPSLVDNEDTEKRIEDELISIILRHQALIRISDEIENMYTFSLLVNFMNSSVIICFCLFCIAFFEKWNEFNYKVFFITAISQTGILCWYGQLLKDTSTGVAEALYNCGWYVAAHNVKKSILIMIHRSQKEVHITTYGFTIISLESYATILKTSWSYFTLLINVMYQD
ncbi:odorant receptor 85b-like [Maniola jurtina]|uniref:odorant receptor 85b-like n=1 Tax=Maniola jurtina TaxID=191418 RepID=UPI001E68B1E7|nr:odorant receptor 85b-like [Maniola jurtina]